MKETRLLGVEVDFKDQLNVVLLIFNAVVMFIL